MSKCVREREPYCVRGFNVYSPDFSLQKIFDFIMFYDDNMERRHLPLFQSGSPVVASLSTKTTEDASGPFWRIEVKIYDIIISYMMQDTETKTIKIRIKDGVAVNVSKYDQYIKDQWVKLEDIEVKKENRDGFEKCMSFVNELTTYLDDKIFQKFLNTENLEQNIYVEINEAILDIALAALYKTKNYLDGDTVNQQQLDKTVVENIKKLYDKKIEILGKKTGKEEEIEKIQKEKTLFETKITTDNASTIFVNSPAIHQNQDNTRRVVVGEEGEEEEEEYKRKKKEKKQKQEKQQEKQQKKQKAAALANANANDLVIEDFTEKDLHP